MTPEEFTALHGGPPIKVGRLSLLADGAALDHDGYSPMFHAPPADFVRRQRRIIEWRQARLRQALDALKTLEYACVQSPDGPIAWRWDPNRLGTEPAAEEPRWGGVDRRAAKRRIEGIIRFRTKRVQEAVRALEDSREYRNSLANNPAERERLEQRDRRERWDRADRELGSLRSQQAALEQGQRLKDEQATNRRAEQAQGATHARQPAPAATVQDGPGREALYPMLPTPVEVSDQ